MISVQHDRGAAGGLDKRRCPQVVHRAIGFLHRDVELSRWESEGDEGRVGQRMIAHRDEGHEGLQSVGIRLAGARVRARHEEGAGLKDPAIGELEAAGILDGCGASSGVGEGVGQEHPRQVRRGRLAYPHQRPKNQVPGPIGGEYAGHGFVHVAGDAAKGELERRTVPASRQVIGKVKGDLEVCLNGVSVHHAFVGHLEITRPTIVPARVSLHGEPGGSQEGRIELVGRAVRPAVRIEERARFEAAPQVDCGRIEVRRQASGSDPQGARCSQGIPGLQALRGRLRTPIQIQLQAAGHAAGHQVRPTITIQIAQGRRCMFGRPGSAVRLGQERPGVTVVLVSPYPTVLDADQQVQVLVAVQIGQEGGAVAAHINAPEVVVRGSPGGVGGCAGVLIEMQAAVFVAHQQIIVAVAVQVAKGRFGIFPHVEALVVGGGQHPVRLGRRAKVTEEIHAAIVLADKQVQVAIAVDVHQGGCGVVQIVGVNRRYQAHIGPLRKEDR